MFWAQAKTSPFQMLAAEWCRRAQNEGERKAGLLAWGLQVRAGRGPDGPAEELSGKEVPGLGERTVRKLP